MAEASSERTFENPWHDPDNPYSPESFTTFPEPVGEYGQGVFYRLTSLYHEATVVLVISDKYVVGQYVTVEGGIRHVKACAERAREREHEQNT